MSERKVKKSVVGANIYKAYEHLVEACEDLDCCIDCEGLINREELLEIKDRLLTIDYKLCGN